MQSGEEFKSEIDWKNTETFVKLQNIFGPKVNLKKLRDVAVSLCNNQNLCLSLTREEKRRKGEKLIQWYEKNWNIIELFLNNDGDINETGFSSFDYYDHQEDIYDQYVDYYD